jgi:hypothetical protein
MGGARQRNASLRHKVFSRPPEQSAMLAIGARFITE